MEESAILLNREQLDLPAASVIPTSTSELANNGDGSSPFVTAAGLAGELTNKATQTYVDDHISAAVAGLLDDRGSFNATASLYPISTSGNGGSGVGGAIVKGDLWIVSVGSGNVTVGDVFRALTDSPGQTPANWAVTKNSIGYVPENSVNKVTSMTGNTGSNVVFLTAKATYDWAVGKFQDALTAVNFGTFISGLLAKSNPVDADGFVISDTAAGGNAKFLSFMNLKIFLKSYFSVHFEEIFYKNTVPTVIHTGSTGQVQMYSAPIPANTFKVGSLFNVKILFPKTGTAGTLESRLYSSATAVDLTFAKIIGTHTRLATNNFQPFSRTYQVVSNSKIRLIQWNINSPNDENVGVANFEERDFDCTSDQWLNSTVALSNATDSTFGAYMTIKGIR